MLPILRNAAYLSSHFIFSALLLALSVTDAWGDTIPTTNLSLWLRADQGVTLTGDQVSEWRDVAGSGAAGIQQNAGNQPVLLTNAANGQPAIRFDGLDDSMKFRLPLNGLTAMTLVLVSAAADNGDVCGSGAAQAPISWDGNTGDESVALSPLQNSVQFGFDKGQASNTYRRSQPAGRKFSITTVVKDGSKEALYIDGALVATAAGKLSAIGNISDVGNLGRGENEGCYFSGEISEVLVYSSALSTAELLQINEYLSSKYDIRVENQLNQVPLVRAGASRAILFGQTVRLEGNATDDGLPFSTTTISWTKVSGPGDVHFGDPRSASTTAEFSEPGSYLVRLAATDGEMIATDEFRVLVNSPDLSVEELDQINQSLQSLGSSTSVDLLPAARTNLIETSTLLAEAAVDTNSATIAVPTGLVAYWTFDERSGTIARNTVGTSNTATLENGASWAAGKIGNGALLLDGNDDRAKVAAATFSGTGNMTIASWVRKVSDGDNNWITDMQSGGSHVSFGIDQRNSMSRLCFANFVNGVLCANFASSYMNQWVHVAVTRPGGGVGTKLYINGAQVASGNVGSDIAGATSWAIGGAADLAAARAFNGQLDDVRIYNRVLTASEILQLVNTTQSEPAPEPAPAPAPSPSPGDTTPPTVYITSPSNGATVSSTLNVTASASDNVSVAKVEFYVDGALRGTSTASPYTYSWPATQWPAGTHTLTAKAYDAAGNNKTCTPVSVTVSSTSSSTSSAGRQFYVATSGSDTNPGTLQQPWRTILKAVNTMQAGDTTLVRGGTYDKFIPIGWNAVTGYDGSAARSGTATAPITLKAYPGEAVTLTNDRSFPSSSWYSHLMIEMRGRSYWVIEGFTFRNQYIGSPGGWWTHAIQLRNLDHVTIRNNAFVGGDLFHEGGAVIDLRTLAHYVLIENNSFNGYPASGDLMAIALESDNYRAGSSSAQPNRNTIIRGNTFNGFGGDAVQIGPFAGHTTLIENNTFTRKYNGQIACGPSRNQNCWHEENGIDIKFSWFTTIRNNTISGYRPKDSSSVGAGLLVHISAQDVVIEGNRIFNCDVGIRAASGYNLFGQEASWYTGDRTPRRYTITRNLIVGSTKQAGQTAGVGRGLYIDGIDQLKIYHNVIALSEGEAVQLAGNTNAEFRNNIIYYNSSSLVDVFKDDGSNLFSGTTLGTNTFSNAGGGAMRWIWRNGSGQITTTTSLATFQAAKSGNCSGCITSNPMFINPAKEISYADYQLRSGSPAIDKGVRLSGINDAFTGAAPDLGAFEW